MFVFFSSITIFLFLSFTVFFFNDTATTEIYTLSLHDALPISCPTASRMSTRPPAHDDAIHGPGGAHHGGGERDRSEEHTSELQSQSNLVCRLLLEKKKNTITKYVRTADLRHTQARHGYLRFMC